MGREIAYVQRSGNNYFYIYIERTQKDPFTNSNKFASNGKPMYTRFVL